MSECYSQGTTLPKVGKTFSARTAGKDNKSSNHENRCWNSLAIATTSTEASSSRSCATLSSGEDKLGARDRLAGITSGRWNILLGRRRTTYRELPVSGTTCSSETSKLPRVLAGTSFTLRVVGTSLTLSYPYRWRNIAILGSHFVIRHHSWNTAVSRDPQYCNTAKLYLANRSISKTHCRSK